LFIPLAIVWVEKRCCDVNEQEENLLILALDEFLGWLEKKNPSPFGAVDAVSSERAAGR